MPPIDQSTPTITSDALITAVAFMPGCSLSSSDASLVIDAVIVTIGDTSIVTWVVVAPGFTALIVPAIWLRAANFIVQSPWGGITSRCTIGVKWRVCISDQIQLYRGLKIQAARVAVGPFILLDITFPVKANRMNTPFDTTFLLNEKFAVGQPVSRKEDRSCCAARVVIQTT